MGNEAYIEKFYCGNLDGRNHLESIRMGRNMILNWA
jgi:hypothetical protein